MRPEMMFGGVPVPLASRWMKELFSSSISSGAPATAVRLPTPAPESDSPVTSLVETNPPDSRRNTTPLPLTTVASPPPPPVPATPPTQEPDTGPWYGPNPPPPCPIQTPAVSVGQDAGRPPVHRSRPGAFSLL